MADPAKLAALQELADTGTYSGAQQNLGASRDAALAQQSSLGSLIGAPTAATASTMPTIQQPYGRFADALSQYQTADERNESMMGGANAQYFAQVADAQAAHRAEADRAIAEAQRAYAKSTGADDPMANLSQWEIENFATGEGNLLQQQAIADEGQNAARNDAEAELAAQLAGWREIGDKEAESQRSMDYALEKEGPTPEEEMRARDQWQADNPQTGSAETRSPLADAIVKEQRNQAMEDFVRQYAGSDRIGSRRAREQAYRYDVEARQNADITLPGGETLSTRPTGGTLSVTSGNPNAPDRTTPATLADGSVLMPDQDTPVEASEAQRYVQARRQGSEDSILNQMMLEMYEGPAFKREAALNLNLRPELSPEAQEIFYAGMFPELTPEEQMDSAKSRRELDYFNETGFSNPQEQRSWEEAERKRAGIPDPESTKVRRPDDPDVMAQTGLSPEAIDQIRNSNQWQEALATTERLLEGDEENGIPAVMSLPYLMSELRAVYDDEEMVKLLGAMYGPSMVG